MPRCPSRSNAGADPPARTPAMSAQARRASTDRRRGKAVPSQRLEFASYQADSGLARVNSATKTMPDLDSGGSQMHPARHAGACLFAQLRLGVPWCRLNVMSCCRTDLARCRRAAWRICAEASKRKAFACGPTGTLATTPHPAKLGSALTHPLVTTDFSESQLELITGVHPSPEACLNELTEIHQAGLPRASATRCCGPPACHAGCPPTSHPHRPVRHVERRPHKERVSHGSVAPLWPAHADDLRHPLQLFSAPATFQRRVLSV